MHLPDWLSISIARATTYFQQRRRDALLNKYQDPAVVDQILQGKILKGSTTEIVREIKGKPSRIRHLTSTREEWEYKESSYHKVIYTFENGRLVGYQDRQIMYLP